MIHMLSSFNLRDGEDFATFRADYTHFVEELTEAGVITGAGPISTRLSDTPMDTDDDNPAQVFSILSFRDRAHLDQAYAHIEARAALGTKSHIRMYMRLRDTVFTCWQDVE
ncbi:MAG: hypothetical protein AB8B82_07815 [Roseovarius sp.]